MSTFSSWGIPGSLEMKPEITAPGGKIYSVNGAVSETDQYEMMSGTSMASPQVAGMAALIAQYIQENYMQDLSVPDIADALNVSRSYLSRLFKKSINLSLIEYINGVRIKAAQNLIEKSNESISDIAEKTGFMTTAHFRRVFKDATGLSPQQYRQYYKRLSK